MTSIFLSLINIGIVATYVLLAVLLLRLCLKKAPRWIRCLLWIAVGLRLLLPFSFESRLSLLPATQTIPLDLADTIAPQIHSGIPVIDTAVNPRLASHIFNAAMADKILFICAVVWLAGIAVFALYGTISSVSLYRKVRASICVRDNIYICDDIDSPFILGILRPRIYLPSGIPQEFVDSVIAHEKAHLHRKDHWWKPLGYIFLMVYWFHPGVWLGYALLCRDIELACDEKAIRNMQAGEQRTYSEAILACNAPPHRLVKVCPLAFGEVGIKDRIKSILSYKKPSLWILIGASLLCVVFAVCFLSDPQTCSHTYTDSITLSPTCAQEGIQTFTCQDCNFSYTQALSTLPHSYSDGQVRTPATCAEEGAMCYTCTACGQENIEAIPVVDHQFNMTNITKAPNCTETGEKHGVCQACYQDILIEVLPVNGEHQLVTESIRHATCAEAGESISVCSLCQHKETLVLDKLAHNYKKEFELPATCRTEGELIERCTECGVTRTTKRPKDSNAHDFVYMGIYFPARCLYCGKTKNGN